jgi:HicA toxin of bacterial toxin-antitoxin,
MSRARQLRTFEAVLRGSAAIKFTDFQALLQALGFRLERSRGSHRIYRHPDIARPFPIQPEGPDAKRYQVHELRYMIQRYRLKLDG